MNLFSTWLNSTSSRRLTRSFLLPDYVLQRYTFRDHPCLQRHRASAQISFSVSTFCPRASTMPPLVADLPALQHLVSLMPRDFGLKGPGFHLVISSIIGPILAALLVFNRVYWRIALVNALGRDDICILLSLVSQDTCTSSKSDMHSD
jgi:hypothetical protein